MDIHTPEEEAEIEEMAQSFMQEGLNFEDAYTTAEDIVSMPNGVQE